MTTTRPRTATSLIALATLSLLAAAPSRAQDQDRMARKIETSRLVFQDLLNLREKKIPQGLLEDAKCIAVIPNVIKGAFMWGGRYGFHSQAAGKCHGTTIDLDHSGNHVGLFVSVRR